MIGRYNPSRDKEKLSEEQKDQDDAFLGESIQPSTNGKIVQITYTLNVTLSYDGCCICSTPTTEIPLFISPPQLPSYAQITAPADWDPEIFEVKNLETPKVATPMRQDEDDNRI